MNVSTLEATAALDDIARIVERVKQSRIYREASNFLVFWGVLVALGYASCYAAPQHGGTIWVAVQTVGVTATAAAVILKRRAGKTHFDLRIIGALLLFLLYGLLWAVVIGHFGARELGAFWATFFMFGYTVAGLWLGRGFIALGLAVTALTVAGYFWAGSAFNLFMAFTDGGGLICCGLWMRRA
jgi:hypothetical protein